MPEPTTLALKTIDIARSFLGARETPPKSNRGPEIDAFLLSASLDPAAGKWPWCAAFVSHCVKEAVVQVGGPPQFKASAGALRLLLKNGTLAMTSPDVVPCVFVIDHGHGKGHCGFVLDVLTDGRLVTIEGNTGPGPAAPAQDREGDGVYERRDRQIADCVGFVRIG